MVTLPNADIQADPFVHRGAGRDDMVMQNPCFPASFNKNRRNIVKLFYLFIMLPAYVDYMVFFSVQPIRNICNVKMFAS